MHDNKKRKVIVHLIYDLAQAGAQTVVMNYVRSMSKEDRYDVHIVLLGKENNTIYEKECKSKGYPVHYCNYCETSIPILRPIINWYNQQRAIYRTLKNLNVDVLHTHITTILPYCIFPAFLLHIKKKVHTLHSDPYAISGRFVLFGKLAFKYMNFKPICVTEAQADKAKQVYKLKNMDVVHNGIDFESYGVHETAECIRDDLGIPKDSFVIGCVGRMDKVKNHNFLLDVFAEVLKYQKNAKLLLVGDGSEKLSIEQYAKNRNIEQEVMFLGTRDDVRRIYSILDCFVLTSLSESSSIVTVEAQLFNVRCVVSTAVPESVVCRRNVFRLSLEEPVQKWASTVLAKDTNNCELNDIDSFSITGSMKKLERIYEEES
ncbi:MAG: glycosyltransferase [Firmicutes bacterium]|nr:glycosyltransferase [Bacillota bacterium]MDY6160891.1 glycosyltransferase [Candidatus Faecousia sp.]